MLYFINLFPPFLSFILILVLSIYSSTSICLPPSLSMSVCFSCLYLLQLPSYPHCFPLSHSLPVALGRNQPLKRERPKWKSDYPMTEGQLRSKRDEFWDTAPAFEGRKEIWDALRAAASAFESNDHLLAQAILDGASITLPHGNAYSL